jgi:hypothetical protein
VLLPATATLSEDMFSILGGLPRRLSRRPPAAVTADSVAED